MNNEAPPRISAVLPAFNEEAVIGELVERTARTMVSLGLPDAEIVVVDDGSDDRTARAADAATTPDVRVRVISHPSNRGYGAALRTGFEAAAGDALWLMDSDGQFDPDDLSKLLEQYRPDRLVCGFRIQRSEGGMRRLNNAAFFSLVHALVGETTVRDVNCGFKLLPRAAGQGLSCAGALISTELIVRAQRAGYETVDVGIPHYPRLAGKATGANPRVVARAFGELWELRRRLDSLNGLKPPG